MKPKPTLTEDLRSRVQAVVDSGVTVYSISKATGVHQSVLGRFLADPEKTLRSDTIDKLAEYLAVSLEQRRKK